MAPGDYSFVVVANRLPVDRGAGPDGETEWLASPGGLVTALEPVVRDAKGAWVGWPGDAGPAPEEFDSGGMHLAGVGPVRGRDAAFLRGLLQCHAVAALSRRHRPAGVPPHLVGGLRHGQPAVRPGRRPPGRAGRHHLGPRLPAAAGAGDAPRAAPRRPDRVLQPHPVPRLRDLRPAALAAADHRRPDRRRPARLPAAAGRDQLHAGLPPGRRAEHPRRADPRARPPAGRGRAGARELRAARPGAGGPPRSDTDEYRQRRWEAAGTGSREVRAAAFPISIDTAAYEKLAGRPDVRARAHGDPRGARRAQHRAARRGPPRLHQGHPAPAAGLQRDPGRGLADRARGGAGAGGQPQPGARRALPAAARRGRGHRRPDERQVRRAGQPAGAVPAPVLPARGDGRAVPGRRRHARHLAAGRHEPGGQGVRGLPPATTPARWC